VIRVVIADDEALVRGGLRMILEAQARPTTARPHSSSYAEIRPTWC
jgi:DNA-binding NarL/FixJ family response regulator